MDESCEINITTVTVEVEEAEAPLAARSLLDRPATGLFRLTTEQAIYLLLLALAIGTRFWALGARAMSHDESLHALFSWKLYTGEGYVHDPMMHGPFLFHANALIYFLFGVSDFTARIVPAVFGVILVGLPYFFRRWMGRAGALVASVLILISPSLMYYSRYIRHDPYMVVWTALLALALFKYVQERQTKWLVYGAAILGFAVTTMENSFIVGFVGLTFVVIAALWERISDRTRSILQLTMLAAVTVLVLGVVALHLAIRPNATGAPTLATKLTPNLMFVALLLVAALAATVVLPRDRDEFTIALRSLSWQTLRLPLLVFLIIFVLLFTTFFTNPRGLYTGSLGGLTYWLAQQPVQRGTQPWYYYIFLFPFYELIPFFVGIPALVYVAYRGARGRLDGFLAAQQVVAAKQVSPSPGGDRTWLAYLVYWGISTLVIYSWAGEKMPWLIVHPTLPLLFIAAQVIGRWIENRDWRAWYKRGGVVLSGIFILMAVGLVILWRVRAFRGLSLQQIQASGRWIAGLIVVGVGAYLAYGYAQRLGGGGALNTLKATVLALLALLTLRFAWMASFVNYDYVNEFLVYAHGSPDLKVVVNELEEVSRRTVGFRELAFSYDQEEVWPLEWYFKDFPKRVFYGNEPTKTALDAPVVLVNGDSEAKAKPFLGDRYYRFGYRLVWWPQEDYKGLTPASILQVLRDPERLDKWLTIWLYRRHPTPFSDWPYQNRFYMYVRKDILNQMWDMGVTMALPEQMPTDAYTQLWQERPASLVVGATGTEEGRFNNPRDVAVAPDGNIYVVDSGNNRVQVFNPDGDLLFAFGTAGTGPGEFTEPWGLAIAPGGGVYVADTWNHRVQIFDAAGTFKSMFGFFADTHNDAQASQGGFWGPRDVAVGADGAVYVTDTGNKRVQEFTPDGQFVAAYGSSGDGPGQLNEPVGLAVDEAGNFYVADTWNQRIQVFDPQFNYLREWRLETWLGQSLMNKPYLEARGGLVYASDPEGYRVLVFDQTGAIKETFGRYGDDVAGMNLPTGLAVDAEGRLWVTDSQNNRLLRFDR